MIDGSFPTSKFEESIAARVNEVTQADRLGRRRHQTRKPLALSRHQRHPLLIESIVAYKYVKFNREKRYADLTMRGPESDLPTTAEEIQKLGDAYWPLQAYRELDDALLHLRVNEPEIGLVCLRTEGNIDDVLAVDKTLAAHRDHWLVREIVLYMARVLRRLDLTAKSFFALIEPGSCFAGNLLELALAADRSYMLNNPDEPVEIAASELNAGALPMSNGLTRSALALSGHS